MMVLLCMHKMCYILLHVCWFRKLTPGVDLGAATAQ